MKSIRIPTIIDTRGKRSHTLLFVVLAVAVVFGWFVHGLFTNCESVSVTDFANAFMMIMAPWVVREGFDKYTTGKENEPVG